MARRPASSGSSRRARSCLAESPRSPWPRGVRGTRLPRCRRLVADARTARAIKKCLLATRSKRNVEARPRHPTRSDAAMARQATRATSIAATRGSMSSDALFGLSILMSFLAFANVTKVYIWPRLRVMHRTNALMPLVIPHTFRFIGLSFLIPGVVSPSLPPAFAIPAAYGDLVAAILAGVATLALAARASWAIPIVWVFNVWGTVDLLHAIYQGQIPVGITPDT